MTTNHGHHALTSISAGSRTQAPAAAPEAPRGGGGAGGTEDDTDGSRSSEVRAEGSEAPDLHMMEFGTGANAEGNDSTEPGASGAAFTASVWPVALAGRVTSL